jgi:Phytanoyl-CoA dioxygenase (PhyH)
MKWGIERSKVLNRMSDLPACGSLIRQQYDNYLRLKYELNWHWVRNPASSRSFHTTPPKLNAAQKRLVEELYSTGLAICHVDELFQEAGLWSALCAEVSEFSSSDEVQSVIRKRQRDFEQKHDFKAIEHYIITKYAQDHKPLITASNTMLNFSLNSSILDVVNSYLGLWSKLIYFDMWYTLPLPTDTRFASQRWHRDPEDRRKIRTFLYFSEVDVDAGAMEYLAGSHFGGPYEHVFQWEDPLGIPYPPDGEVERQIPASQHVILEGRPGTLIFCDTAGFHRGGISKTKPRILATSAFVTPASLHGRRYEIDATVRDNRWSPPAGFAVM